MAMSIKIGQVSLLTVLEVAFPSSCGPPWFNFSSHYDDKRHLTAYVRLTLIKLVALRLASLSLRSATSESLAFQRQTKATGLVTVSLGLLRLG